MIDINMLRQSLGAVQPEEVGELLDRLEAAEKERDTYKAACNEWIAKTEWVQDEITRSKLPAKYLGMHRADGIKVEIDTLRAKIEQMERQEPAGTLHDDGCFVWRETAPHQSNYAGWKMVLYALPGAKGCETSVAGLGAETEWAAGYIQATKDFAEGIRARGDT